jgi:hypothetical protein
MHFHFSIAHQSQTSPNAPSRVSNAEGKTHVTGPKGENNERMLPQRPPKRSDRSWYTLCLFHVKSREVASPPWEVFLSVKFGGYETDLPINGPSQD